MNTDLAAIFEAEQVFEAYARNVQRIVDAYTRAQKEVKADLTAKLAGALGGAGLNAAGHAWRQLCHRALARGRPPCSLHAYLGLQAHTVSTTAVPYVLQSCKPNCLAPS